MHIAIFTRVIPHHSIGGMQAVVWDLARAFSRLGNKVTVVTAEVAGRPEVFEDEGIHVVTVRGVRWNRYGATWWRGTREIFKKLGPALDVVLGVSAAANSLLPLRDRFPLIPFIMQAHGTSVGEVISKWRSLNVRNILSSARNIAWVFKDLHAYGRYDNVVAVGDRVVADLKAAPTCWVLSGERVRLIRNGIDANAFQPCAQNRIELRERLGWSGDENVIISASRLHKQKGIELSLNAVAALSRRLDRIRYLIVGDGPERGYLEQCAARLGLRDKVFFAGAVARDNLPSYFQAADTMLFTTTHVEGLPLNVLEALATGLPCVVSEHIFNAPIFAADVLRVSPHDSEVVACALQRALAEGRRPKSVLPPMFSLAECAEAYLDLFSKISSQRCAVKSYA